MHQQTTDGNLLPRSAVIRQELHRPFLTRGRIIFIVAVTILFTVLYAVAVMPSHAQGVQHVLMGPHLAQSATIHSFPSSVTIEFDTDVLFSSVNDWISIFLPIMSIGLAIAIAMAIIGFVGESILKGFRSR